MTPHTPRPLTAINPPSRLTAWFKRALPLWLLLASCAAWAAPVAASASPAPLVLTGGQAEYLMAPYAEYLEDPSGQLTFQLVSSPARAKDWQPWRQQTVALGFNPTTYWFRVAVENQTEQTKWMVDTSNPGLITAAFYTVTGKAVQGPFNAGLDTPITSRQVQHVVSRYLMTVPKGERQTLYVKIQSDALFMELALRSHANLFYSDLTDNLLNGSYLGLFLAMLAYNLLAAFKFRDKKYGLYALYIFFLGGFSMSLKGLTTPFFLREVTPDRLNYLNWSIIALVSFCMIFLTSFILAFLWEVLGKKEKWLLRGWLGLLLLATPASLLLTLQQAGDLLNNLFMLTQVGVLAISSLQWRRGYRPARYLALAMAPEMGGLILMSMAYAGVAPVHFFTLNGALFGSALGVILFSMALADRVSLLRQEKESAQAKALEQERLAVKRLEENQELRLAKEQAEAATALKDKFVSLVAHDVRSPFAALMVLAQTLEEHQDPPLTPEQQEMARNIRQRGAQFTLMVDDLLNLNRLQTGHLQPEITLFQPWLVVEEVFLMRHLAQDKAIALKNEIPEDLELSSDRQLVMEVIRNLVSNAIKFCRPGDTITVFSPLGQPATLAVRDTGVGISPDILPHLFSPEVKTTSTGTAGETGTGLGLPLCAQIMAALGGSLTVESQPGQGATFFLTLPPPQKNQRRPAGGQGFAHRLPHKKKSLKSGPAGQMMGT